MNMQTKEKTNLPAIDNPLHKSQPAAATNTAAPSLQEMARQLIETDIAQAQRRFFLEEQLKLIQQELGMRKDGRSADSDLFRERLQRLTMPAQVRRAAAEELHKFSILKHGSTEYNLTRNYLEWLTSLPWGRYSQDVLDVQAARRVLDAGHCGLDDVKLRIMEFLAVGAYRGEMPAAVLLLVGPPGVGKSTISRAIAQALGRKFYHLSMGGIRGEEDIKGTRRVLPGAMPGMFIRALKDCDVANPVIMIEGLDKIASCYKGDPTAAILEVLDPDHNREFHDQFLGLDFDFSRVLFICTANQLYSVPGALLDRMEIIRLVGYIAEEKLAIAKTHLWPKQLAKAGVKTSKLKITDAALRQVIEGYAREAGVRGLDKRLGRIVRKAVFTVLGGAKLPLRITPEDLETYLGPPVFHAEKPMSGIGVVTGLAWTASGGVTLPVEASVVNRKKTGFKLTGKLGDVMRESAEIAYSYTSAHAQEFSGTPDFFDQCFVHVHMPEGAIPKDGPSAGITMAVALLSLARDELPKGVLAMTGELTLTGHVLRVGGIREKVIAARRSRIRELILPADNRSDYLELPEYVRAGMKIHFVRHFQEVVPLVFKKRALTRKPRPKA